MDISNRGPQPAPHHGQVLGGSPAPVHHNIKPESDAGGSGKYLWYRVGVFVAILAIVALLCGLTALIYAQNNSTKNTENKYVYGNRLQAVFLNTGQVYFGNIKSLNNNFFVLTNIFYLQTSSTGSSGTASSSSSANSNVSLVKLGCELHRPYDLMVINRTQVTFWEDLETNGQVAKAVAQWQQQHPKGQQCVDQSSSSSNTTNRVQNTTNSSTTKP